MLGSKPHSVFTFIRGTWLYEPYKRILGDRLIVRQFIPREEILAVMSKADFLVDIANEGSVQKPSKLIDYTIAGRPILEVTSAFLEASDVDEFLAGDYSHAMPFIDLSQYDIKNVAKSFLELAE